MLLLIHLPRGLVIFSGFLNNCRTTDIRSSPSEVMREERWDLWELLRRAGAVPVSRSCRPGDSGLSPLNLGTQVSPQNAGRVPVVARGQAGCAAKALPWQDGGWGATACQSVAAESTARAGGQPGTLWGKEGAKGGLEEEVELRQGMWL